MKMLVCSIGSRKRKSTLRFAAEVATALSADTTFFGVTDKNDVSTLGETLDSFVKGLEERGLPARARVEWGDPEATVMKELGAASYDMVALGALAERRSWRNFGNSVAMRIIEKAKTSVLVVKGSRPSVSSVLICASGAGHGHLAVWAGGALACGAGASATVLHVVDAMPSMYAGLERMEETLSELLESDSEKSRELKWAAQVVKAECEISELKLRRGLVVDEILRESQDGNHDLIVLGSSRTAGGLVRALMGDVTREIVSRAQRPVLVVRPAG